MNFLTPALGWFLAGVLCFFFGFLFALSAEGSSDSETGFLIAWLFFIPGTCAALVGVIAKAVEVGIRGAREAQK